MHRAHAGSLPAARRPWSTASQREFIAQCRLPEDGFFADAFGTAAGLAAR